MDFHLLLQYRSLCVCACVCAHLSIWLTHTHTHTHTGGSNGANDLWLGGVLSSVGFTLLSAQDTGIALALDE